MKLNKQLQDEVYGWSYFKDTDSNGYNSVIAELNLLTCFADMTIGSAHKMCKNLTLNGQKLSINQFSKFFI
jgi:hypothetical protein